MKGRTAHQLGGEMHELCRKLFPICRSITGNGFRQSLSLLRELVPDIRVHEIPSGTKCFDWEVPPEWNIRDAYIGAPDGTRLCEFSVNNLSVVGYSVPVDKTVSLSELQEHLHSLPEQADAIPYVTSYYERRWGFCIPHSQRLRLREGNYRVLIDSDLKPGSLTYGELIIPGRTNREIFLSTYLCHPSLANNELSGPVVTTFIAKWLQGLADRRYTYRIIFIPETIGSIAYLSRNLETMKANVEAGFNVTCIGDDRAYSYLPSRAGDTVADKVALHVLKHLHPEYLAYTFLDRGSDERQYCSPGVDLPVCSVMRSKYHCYPEYHTSKDDLTLVTPEGLHGGYEVLRRCLECMEANLSVSATVLCEPQLGKRGLYPTLSAASSRGQAAVVKNLLAYADGRTILEIADLLGIPHWELSNIVHTLVGGGLLKVESASTRRAVNAS